MPAAFRGSARPAFGSRSRARAISPDARCPGDRRCMPVSSPSHTGSVDAPKTSPSRCWRSCSAPSSCRSSFVTCSTIRSAGRKNSSSPPGYGRCFGAPRSRWASRGDPLRHHLLTNFGTDAPRLHGHHRIGSCAALWHLASGGLQLRQLHEGRALCVPARAAELDVLGLYHLHGCLHCPLCWLTWRAVRGDKSPETDPAKIGE